MFMLHEVGCWEDHILHKQKQCKQPRPTVDSARTAGQYKGLPVKVNGMVDAHQKLIGKLRNKKSSLHGTALDAAFPGCAGWCFWCSQCGMPMLENWSCSGRMLPSADCRTAKEMGQVTQCFALGSVNARQNHENKMYRRTIEQPRLEGTYKDHQVQHFTGKGSLDEIISYLV